jgi:hypothetical protein
MVLHGWSVDVCHCVVSISMLLESGDHFAENKTSSRLPLMRMQQPGQTNLQFSHIKILCYGITESCYVCECHQGLLFIRDNMIPVICIWKSSKHLSEIFQRKHPRPKWKLTTRLGWFMVLSGTAHASLFNIFLRPTGSLQLSNLG